MVAGAAADGKTFEQLQFNDQYPDTNPVTGEPLDPVPFANTSQGFSGTVGDAAADAQPWARVRAHRPGHVLGQRIDHQQPRGVDVEVIQIGSTTCGKPYGFYPADNCGTTYFSIQFRGINAKGFGDYSDGFSPENTAGSAGSRIARMLHRGRFHAPAGGCRGSAARRSPALPFLRHLRQSAERLCSADGEGGAAAVRSRRRCLQVAVAREPHSPAPALISDVQISPARLTA